MTEAQILLEEIALMVKRLKKHVDPKNWQDVEHLENVLNGVRARL